MKLNFSRIAHILLLTVEKYSDLVVFRINFFVPGFKFIRNTHSCNNLFLSFSKIKSFISLKIRRNNLNKSIEKPDFKNVFFEQKLFFGTRKSKLRFVKKFVKFCKKLNKQIEHVTKFDEFVSIIFKFILKNKTFFLF